MTDIDFGAAVRRAQQHGSLVVQPRMGFDDPWRMRAGLLAVKSADATTVGTITLDSYTRVGDLDAVAAARAEGIALNGYPIASHTPSVTRQVLAEVQSTGFPVQVRHGSAEPTAIFRTMAVTGLSASEGGPVSYCLPYGRTPLARSVRNWADCCQLLAAQRTPHLEPHLETFGGCMLGQLCPPSQLVALSVLEALFFLEHGLRSVSVSYAQQTNGAQDEEAVFALRRLCAEFLPTGSWHVVVYTYMGLYPTTEAGGYRLLARSAELAAWTGAERLVVKTVAESSRLPTVRENVKALEYAATVARSAPPATADPAGIDSQTYQEARSLVDAVLNLGGDLATALIAAFGRGYLDIPFCLHPDNAGQTRSYIDEAGWLRWADTGRLPLSRSVRSGAGRTISADNFHDAISYVRRLYDCDPADAA